MERKRRKLRERICALALAVILSLTGVLPQMTIVQAAPGDLVDVTFEIVDETGIALSGATVTVGEASEQTDDSGTCTITNLVEGTEYSYTVTKDYYGTVDDTLSAGNDLVPVMMSKEVTGITLTTSEKTIEIDGTCTITAVTSPIEGKECTWNSSDPTVATVTNGVVTGISAGSTTITAAYGDVESQGIEIEVKKIATNISLTTTVEPDTKEDTSSIRCDVTGAPADAYLTYYADDEVFYEGTDTSATYQNQDDNLIGDITFRVVYDGDEKYEGSNATADVNGLYRNQKIVLTDTANSDTEPKIVTRPEAGKDALNFAIGIDDNNSLIKGKISYSTTSDLVRVDSETGMVSIDAADGTKKSGLAEIIVTAEEKDTYWKKAAAKYYVYVQEPVAVDELADQFTVSAEKMYDSSNDLAEINATISADKLHIYTGKIDTNQPVKFVFEGTTEQKDANTYIDEKVVLTKLVKVVGYNSSGIEVDLTDQITVLGYSNVKLTGMVIIKKKEVKLGTEDVTVEYAKDAKTIKEQFDSASAQYGTAGKAKVTNEDAAELLSKDNIDITKFKTTVDNDDYLANEEGYASAVKPVITELNTAYTNYNFVEDTAALGTLTVTKANFSIEQLVDIIDFTSTNTQVYTKDDQKGTVWMGGGTLSANIASNSPYAKFFDSVVSEEEDLTNNGYQAAENKTYSVSKNISLKKSGKPQTETKKFTIIVDQTAPGFTFGEWKEGKKISDVFAQIVTFNKYKNTDFSLDGVEAHDNLSENDLGSGLKESGVQTWNYKIYETTSTEDITSEKLEDFAQDPASPWILAEEGTKSIPVAVRSGDVDLSEIEGNYIVLVNVIDNVGNEVTLTSEGLILDYRMPKVEIVGADGSEIKDSVYYNDDVKYKVKFFDETVTSGFKNAKIEVLDGENVLETMEYDFLKLYSEEKNLTDKGNSGLNDDGGYTLSQIGELASRELATTTGTPDGEELAVSKTYDSNNLRIRVTAYDQADKETVKEQALMIDNTPPEISVEYSSIDKEGSNVTAQNDKYYKAPRTMVVTYTEKNFDANGVTFDVLSGPNIDPENPDTGISVSGLSEYGITVQNDKNGNVFTDSESNGKPNTYTGKRTNTLTLVFDKDNEYYIRPHCKDLAGLKESVIKYSGNDTETAKTTFVIDQTAPVIYPAEYSSLDSGFVTASKTTDKPSTAYSNQDVNVKVVIDEKNFRITENNFAAGQMNFDATKGENPNVTPSCLDTAKNAGMWSGQGITYSCNLRFLVGMEENDAVGVVDTTGEDANYTFGFTYTDLAGNAAVYAPEYFTVDNNHPTGEYAVDGVDLWQKVLEVLTFGVFKSKESTVTLTGNDVTAGVDKIYYHKSAEYLTQTQFEELEKNNQWTEGTSFSVSPNEQYVVYEKIVDKARNITYRYPENGVVADNQGPRITLTDSSPTINGFHNGDVTVGVDVEDPIYGNTYSGLKYVWYQITSAGNVVNATPGERTAAYTLKDNTSNPVKDEANRTYKGNIIVPAKEFNSNDVTVTVFAEDFAGTVVQNEIKLKIDVTAPVVEPITWNTSAASNGKYYNVTRVATITVRERNFDPNQVRLNITNTDGTMPEISGWNVDSSGTSDNNISTCTVTFSADGDYNMNMSCTDLAGWDSNTVTVDEFTIDKTAPIINVTFDNNSAANGKYYNAARTATITVNEHNFNGSEVQTAITSNAAIPSVNGWSTGGDVHTATVPFTTDGNYSFTVNYTDLAGNAAQVYNVDEFVIDLTKPEIEIFDIVDKSANNGEVAPGVRYSDTNYDVNGISITYSGSKHSAKAVDGARSSIPNGESIKMADFEHTAETDDVYTMVAKVTDLAGNSDEKQVTFSVNRFGSNFIFSEETEKFLDDYYNNEEETLVVTEINVDTLTHRGISCGHDGNLTDFKEGTDYTVKASGSEVSWKSYVYTIKKDNFEKEGLYNITIDSVDRATNQVNNKIKEADIEFVIDKTAPTVVITGVEDGGQYRSNERDITIAAADNVAMERVELYVNSDKEPAESFNAKTIERQKGELPYTLTSSSDWQEIKAIAVDMAGNVADTSILKEGKEEQWLSVLVTSNVFVQFYRNTPLVVGTVIGVIALAGIIFLILAKRRKKDEEENAAVK